MRSRLKPGHTNRPRVLRRAATGAFIGVIIAFAPAAPASADPSPAEYEKQIDALWNQIEPTIEEHNAIKAQLTTNQAKVAQLTEQIRPLQLQVDAAMDKVSIIAVEYYKGGPASTI